MLPNQIKTPQDVLVYVTDCNLATIEYMAALKRKSKFEFERQIAIAQMAYDQMKKFGIDYSGTRAEEVDKFKDVKSWANMIKNF